jgi:hypothetical protein
MVKVVEPSPLVQEAAEIISPLSDRVVVIGAAALQVIMAADAGEAPTTDGVAVEARRDIDLALVITPTRDVDLAINPTDASDVARALEAAGLQRSDEPYERGFTWVREDDLKIQLVRSYHPFPDTVAKRLPTQPAVSLLQQPGNRLNVAFASEPARVRMQTATAASLVALKHAAFGRTRPDGTPVERDFHDVFSVAFQRLDDLEAACRDADHQVRARVIAALRALAADGDEARAAARQHALLTDDADVATHTQRVRRTAVFALRRLGEDA